MPARDVDAIFFVGKAPLIEFEDGLFRVSYDIGKHARFEVVMRPKLFMEAMLLAQEATAKWRLEGCPTDNVRRIGKRS